jgi:hypothetical protein
LSGTRFIYENLRHYFSGNGLGFQPLLGANKYCTAGTTAPTTTATARIRTDAHTPATIPTARNAADPDTPAAKSTARIRADTDTSTTIPIARITAAVAHDELKHPIGVLAAMIGKN